MAARDFSIRVESDPHKDIAPETLDQAHSLPGPTAYVSQQRPCRNVVKHPLYEREALLGFTNANPNARIDIAFVQHGDFGRETVIGRIRKRGAGIEGSAGGSPDKAAGAELARQIRFH